MSAQMTVDNAPRDLQGLLQLSRAIRYRLALASGALSDDTQEQGFLNADENTQAQTLYTILQNYDANGGQTVSQPQTPGQPQQQLPLSQPQYPPQMPQQVGPGQAPPMAPQGYAPMPPPGPPPGPPQAAAPPAPPQQAPQAPPAPPPGPPTAPAGFAQPPMMAPPQQAPPMMPPQGYPPQAPPMMAPQMAPQAPPQQAPPQPQMSSGHPGTMEHQIADLSNVVAGATRVLETVGLLTLLVAENVLGVPQDELLKRLDYDKIQRTYQKLTANSSGN